MMIATAEYLGIEAEPLCGSLKDGVRCVLPKHTRGHCVGTGDGWLRPTWDVDHPDVHDPDESALAVGIEIERIDMPHAFVIERGIDCDRCSVSHEAHDAEMAATRAELIAAGWIDREAPDPLQPAIDVMREYLDTYGDEAPRLTSIDADEVRWALGQRDMLCSDPARILVRLGDAWLAAQQHEAALYVTPWGSVVLVDAPPEPDTIVHAPSGFADGDGI